MKTCTYTSKRSFRFVKNDGRYKVVRRPFYKSGRVQPGHRVKRM